MGGLLLGLLIGYVVGGLSFLPLLAWSLWIWNTRHQSDSQAHTSPRLPDQGADTEFGDWGAGLGEDLLHELKNKHAPDAASGYFAICREYVPGGVNGKPPDRNASVTGSLSAMESPSVYQSMYRSIFDRTRNSAPTLNTSPSQGKNKRPRNVFYVVLRSVIPSITMNTHSPIHSPTHIRTSNSNAKIYSSLRSFFSVLTASNVNQTRPSYAI